MQAAWEKLHTGCWKDADPTWRNAYSLACLLRALVMLSGACAALPAESPRLCSKAAPKSQQSRAVSSQGPPQEDAPCAGNTAPGGSQPEWTAAEPARVSTVQHRGALSLGRTDCVGMPAGALPSAAACSAADTPAPVHACTSDRQTFNGQAAEAQHMPNGGSYGVPEAGAIEAAMRELDMGLMMGGVALAGSLHAAMAIAEDAWSRNASSFLPGSNHCEQPQQSGRHRMLHHEQLQHGNKRKRGEPEEGAGSSLGHDVTRSEACPNQNGPRKAPVTCSQDGWRGTAVWPHDESSLEEQRRLSVPPGAQGCSAAIGICCRITWTSLICKYQPENIQLCASSAICLSVGLILKVPGRACLRSTSACRHWTGFLEGYMAGRSCGQPCHITGQLCTCF